MTLQLHEFQKQAVAAVRARAREGHRRLVLTVPCGGGKTVMAAAMMQAASHRGKNSLFLAPARELIRQCSEKLTSYGIHHGIVMAGHGFTRSRVQVASVQTIQARAFRTNKISLPQADLVVVDEAHLFGGEKFMEVLRCYPEAVVIGLTATPLGANNKPMPDDFYSDVVVGATTSDLIGQGFIVPVRCWAPYTPLLKRKKGEKAFTATGDYRDDFLEKRMNKPKLIGDIVKHWVKLGEGRPTVATACSVAHSQAIVGEFVKKGIRFGHVDGTTEPELRQELFGRFKDGKLQGLSSCSVLHTGIDFPWASCGILARPTKSLRLYLQIVGRIMRSYPSKDCARLIDHAGCVAYHGFPDEDQDWKLGGDSDQAEENAKKREEGDQKKPIHCPQCHTMFANSNVCPACGFEVKKRQDPNKVKAEAGILVEICRDPSSPLGRQNLAKLWHKCLAIASARNETFGLAASMFIREAKTPPWKLNFLPNLPQPDGWKLFVRDVYPQYTRHRVL